MTKEFIDNNQSILTAGSQFSFGNLPLGAGNKFVIVALFTRKGNAGAASVESATLNGAAMEVVQVNFQSNYNVLAFLIVETSAEAGDLVVNMNTSFLRMGIQYYTATGISPIPYSTASSTGNTTVTVDAGYTFGVAGRGEGGVSSWPQGLYLDSHYEFHGWASMSVASRQFDEPMDGLDVQVATTWGASYYLLVICFSFTGEEPAKLTKWYSGIAWIDCPARRWDGEQWTTANL